MPKAVKNPGGQDFSTLKLKTSDTTSGVKDIAFSLLRLYKIFD